MKNLFTLFVLFLAFVTHPLLAKKASTIHVLLTADTVSNLKKASKWDLDRMRRILLKISCATGLVLDQQELYDERLSKKSIANWIERVRIFPDDVLFFYYTGHGFRTTKTKSNWPLLYFASSGENVDMDHLARKLKGKGARLLIIFSDCCNNVRRHKSPSAPAWLPKNIFDTSIDGYKRLFLETEGTIMTSASLPGEVSWATDRGGVFTISFLESLEQEVTQESPEWGHLLDYTKMLCKSVQEPQFDAALRLQPIPPVTMEPPPSVVTSDIPEGAALRGKAAHRKAPKTHP